MHRKNSSTPFSSLKSRFVAGLLCSAFSFAPAFHAEAREMQGRLGVGYNAEFANTTANERVPGMSLKYGLSRDLATELVFGLSTATPTNSVMGVKLFKNIFYETNLNFYGFGGGALLSAQNNSGIQLMGGLGAEFFVPGLESLGFAMETGGSLDTVSGSMAIRTLGASFFDAGIHFYF